MSEASRHHQAIRYLGAGFRQTYLAGDLYLSGKLHGVVRQHGDSKAGAHLIWLQRGDELIQGQRYREALLCYQKAIEANPENHFIGFKKGMALDGLHRYGEAIVAYRQVIEMTPEDYLVWFKLGKACENAQRYDEALAAYQQVIQLQPTNHWAQNDQGRMLECLERYEESLVSYQQALALKADFWMAAEGRDRVARRVKEKAPRMSQPQSNDAINWLMHGMDMEEAGKDEAAIVAYRHVVKVLPENHQVWLKLGELLEKLSRPEQALAAYDQVVQLQPNQPQSWCLRGRVLEALEDYEEALLSYKRATRVKPDYLPGVTGLKQMSDRLQRQSKSLESAA
jgi:tetratricopeptide (TPR) repeat protein